MHSLFYTLERGDEQIDLEIQYAVARFYPARISGPPEYCYPAEGGEVTELHAYLDDQPFSLTDAEAAAVEGHIYQSHDYYGG